MSPRQFIVAIVVVVVVGIVLGGSFVAGVALGRTQFNLELASFPVAPSSSRSAVADPEGQTGAEIDAAQLQQLRQRAQSGEISQEELARLREQLGRGNAGAPTSSVLTARESAAPQQGPAGGFGRMFGSMDRTVGTVSSMEDGGLIIDTLDGPVDVTVGQETEILGLAERELGDLTVGATVVVSGSRSDSGEVVATSITELPADMLGPGVGGRPTGGGAQP